MRLISWTLRSGNEQLHKDSLNIVVLINRLNRIIDLPEADGKQIMRQALRGKRKTIQHLSLLWWIRKYFFRIRTWIWLYRNFISG
jgi:hypothetical protein